MTKEFKILSIDGGGFRGVYPAHFLARMEEEYSLDWLESFNLITGTSTGSIIAAGIVCGVPMKEILALYEEHGEKIFKKGLNPAFGFLGSRYNNTHLKSALKDVFGEKKLGDLSFPLIIPSTDIGNGGVHVFKSSYDAGFVRDKDVLVRDAVLASCSAPTYFDPIKVGKYSLCDGGLWANSPSLVAAVDAKKRLGQKLENLKVFSVGTGISKRFYPFNDSPLLSGWGFLSRWGRGKFIDMILNLQSQNANNMLFLLLEKSQILRINFESESNLPLDEPKELHDLVSRADREFTHRSEEIKGFLGLTSEVVNDG